MTDLSTTNLQRLLEQATPGPWVRHPHHPRMLCNLERRFAVHAELARTGAEPEPEDVANTELIALAPPLAEEVVRLRGRIEGIILAMETKAANNEWQDPATIASYLKEIVLGGDDV